MKTRSFKLIKSYPNSENVGSVYTKTDLCENYWYYTNCLSPADVEDNPEFFEEIIERQPLLVTHDGVELFEGDSVWGFYTGFGYIFEQIDLKRAKEEQWLKFSSREKAEDYIMYNKPVLSINDLKNIRADFPESSSSLSVTYGALRQLVKSRL
jgi:hypothetical protein